MFICGVCISFTRAKYKAICWKFGTLGWFLCSPESVHFLAPRSWLTAGNVLHEVTFSCQSRWLEGPVLGSQKETVSVRIDRCRLRRAAVLKRKQRATEGCAGRVLRTWEIGRDLLPFFPPSTSLASTTNQGEMQKKKKTMCVCCEMCMRFCHP